MKDSTTWYLLISVILNLTRVVASLRNWVPRSGRVHRWDSNWEPFDPDNAYNVQEYGQWKPAFSHILCSVRDHANVPSQSPNLPSYIFDRLIMFANACLIKVKWKRDIKLKCTSCCAKSFIIDQVNYTDFSLTKYGILLYVMF